MPSLMKRWRVLLNGAKGLIKVTPVLKKMSGDISGGPVVKIPSTPVQEAQVQSLVRELDSACHLKIPCGPTKS